MTNEMYLFRFNDINLLNIREKNELDEKILRIIKECKGNYIDLETLALYVSKESNFSFDMVLSLIKEYKVNGLLSNDLKVLNSSYNKFINQNKKNRLKEIRNFLYDVKDHSIRELSNLDDDLNRILSKKSTYMNNYENIDYSFIYEIYNYMMLKQDIDKDNRIVDMAHTIRKIKSYIDDYRLDILNDYLSNIEVVGPFYDLEIYNKYFKNQRLMSINYDNDKVMNLDYSKNGEIKKYLDENLYLSIGLGRNCEKSFREYESNIVATLIGETQKNIFIISTESPSSGHEKPAIAFNGLGSNIHKRYISGLRNKTDAFEIIYDKDKRLFGERFSRGIHSKIIVIDNEIVIMGSGNWFTNKANDFDDSLVVFKCEKALSRYNPVYSRNSDYYKLIEKQINVIDNLEDAFNFLRLINSDAVLNSIACNVDPNLDRNIIDKIISILPNHLNNYRVLYDFINDNSGFVQDSVKEIVINNLNKLLSTEERKELENAFIKYEEGLIYE